MNATDQQVYHKVASSKKKAMTLDQLQNALPSMNAKTLKLSVNHILMLRMFQAEKTKDDVVVFHAVEKQDAEKQRTLTEEQKVVLSVIANVHNRGISKSAIASAMSTDMSKVQVNRLIDTLEKGGHIKSFKGIANPVTPLYILANLDPPEDVSGGIWYDENKEYDDHLVNSLMEVLFKFVHDKTYRVRPTSRDRQILPVSKTTGLPNPQTLFNHLKDSGILGSSVNLKVKNVVELMRALALEGRVEVLKPLGGVQFDVEPDSDSEDERPSKKRRKDGRSGGGTGGADDDDLDEEERERRARKKKEKEKAKLKAKKKEEKRLLREQRKKKKERERKKKKREEERRRKKKREEEKERKRKRREKERKKEKEDRKKKRVVDSEDEQDDTSDSDKLVAIEDTDLGSSSKRSGKRKNSKMKSDTKRDSNGRKRKRNDDNDSDDEDEVDTDDSDDDSRRSDSDDDNDDRTDDSDSDESDDSDSDDSDDSDDSEDDDSDSDVSSVASEDIDRLNTKYKPKTTSSLLGSNPPFTNGVNGGHGGGENGNYTIADLNNTHDLAIVYRATQPPQVSLGQTQVPCGKCPQFNLCDEKGPVNGSDCVYLSDWLSGLVGGWDAEVVAKREQEERERKKRIKDAKGIWLNGELGLDGQEDAQGWIRDDDQGEEAEEGEDVQMDE